jgi:hypothetical protein
MAGYRLASPEVEAEVEGNDRPNGRYAMANSDPADFVLRS